MSVLQLSNQRRLLEIELNEGLLRRRSDLQESIHTGGADVVGAASQIGNVDTRREELRVLESSVDDLESDVARSYNASSSSS